MELAQSRRGQYVNTKYLNKANENMDLSEQYITLEYDLPLASLISNFFDQLKNLSSGYASMEYEFIDFFPVNLVKVAVLVNHEEIPALSLLRDRRKTQDQESLKILKIMKDVIPRQLLPPSLSKARYRCKGNSKRGCESI